jgi:predicted nucleic acid-binding protein
MVTKRVLDTNVALYMLSGQLARPLESAEFYVSVITELELLSYPQLSSAEEKHIHAFISEVSLVDLNAEIRSMTVRLRREYKLKLPDAIICATAMVLDAELLSNDEQLKKVSQLKVVTVLLKSD